MTAYPGFSTKNLCLLITGSLPSVTKNLIAHLISDDMKVKVKLYGTLSQRFPGYKRSDGLEFEMPDGAKVKDLLTLLHISKPKEALVIMDGRVLNADDPVQSGVPVNVLQAIQGG
jgi:sulfur carrier protein ThiS